jgi:hypothetical protein
MKFLRREFEHFWSEAWTELPDFLVVPRKEV